MLDFLFILKQRKFDEQKWLDNADTRKYVYRDIINSRLLIGKNVLECEKLLGTRCRKVYYDDESKLQKWHYSLYKNSLRKKRYSLMIRFENDIVISVKLVSKAKN